MRRWSRLTISSAAALLLLLLSACSSAQSSSPGLSGTATARADTSLLTPPGGKHVAAGAPVKIGLINDEGGTAESFPDIRVGAEAAVGYANAYLGGIAGRPIKLDECESKGTPASSAACANQMVADHVTMVLHGIDSDAGTTAQTVMNAGIPVVSTAPSSAQEMTSQLSFSLTGGATAFVAALGQYMTQQHYKSSVLFALNAPGGSALYQTAIQFLQHAGISTKLVMVPPGTADITPQMDAAVAQHPGFLWMLGDAGLCLSFLKAYRASGSSAGIGLIGQCSDKQVTSVISPAGAIATEYSVPNGTNTEARLYQTVLATYAAGTDPAGLAYVGYTMALGVVRALRGMTGPVTAQTVAAQMRAARNVVLPVADGVTFSCNGKQVPPFPAPCSDTVFIVRLNAQGLPGAVLEKLQAANLFG